MSLAWALQEARFEPLDESMLEQVMPIEQTVYSHPWTRGNFVDSLRGGYQAQVLKGGDTVLGYFVAMLAVDEVHLLNLSVAPGFQRQGWARVLLDGLAIWARGQGAHWLWLEVRVSNERARHVYAQHGFRQVGLRRNYYPLSTTQREDAVIMSLSL